MERYISLQINILRIVDSFQFLPFALGELVKNVKDFVHLKEHFSDENQLRLLTKKGVFPYDYMESMERFQETSLPAKQNSTTNSMTHHLVMRNIYMHRKFGMLSTAKR